MIGERTVLLVAPIALVEGLALPPSARFADVYDYSRWFGKKDGDRPADLGYWVGYRIAQTYYENSADKTKAIHDILKVRNANGFLKKSGYRGE